MAEKRLSNQDLVGEIVGNFEVLDYVGIKLYNKGTFLIRCVCDKLLYLTKSQIYQNVSCGCLREKKKAKLYVGSDNACAKFNDKEIQIIRHFYKIKAYNLKQLAKMYDVSSLTIKKIVQYETYKNVRDLKVF